MKQDVNSSGVRQVFALALYFLSHLRKVVGIVLCILIIILLNSSHDLSHRIKEKTGSLVGSAYAFFTFPLSTFSGLPDFFYNYMLAVEENTFLKKKVESLTQELLQLKLELGEANRLKQQLNFIGSSQTNILTGRIISYNDNSSGHVFALNIGSADGVNISNVVVNNNILLGKIIDVGTHTAKIQSILDSTSRVPAITSNGRQKMIIGGNGVGNFIAPIFFNTLEPPKDGDIVITSGDGGIFPYGLIIGAISLVGTNITIKPAQDLLDLEFAQVLITH